MKNPAEHTAEHAWFDGKGEFHSETLTCVSVGKTFDGSIIWKDVEDAYSCYIYVGGLFEPYEPNALDKLTELYGIFTEGWQGEGWYTFAAINGEGYLFKEADEAVWIENGSEYQEYSKVPEGYECEVHYYGDDDPPNEDVRIAERFVATLSPEQLAIYRGEE